MSFDIDKLSKLMGKKEESNEKVCIIENSINITATLCCIFNQWIVEFLVGASGLIYIALKNVWLLGVFLFIWFILKHFLNTIYSIIKNCIVNFVSTPLRAISQPLYLLVVLVIDSLICWYVSLFTTGYIYATLKTNSIAASIFATIIATILTKGIFLADTANPEIVKLSEANYNINITINYTVIFAASLYIANLSTIAMLSLGLKGGASLSIYAAMLIIPSLIYIIAESIKLRLLEVSPCL